MPQAPLLKERGKREVESPFPGLRTKSARSGGQLCVGSPRGRSRRDAEAFSPPDPAWPARTGGTR